MLARQTPNDAGQTPNAPERPDGLVRPRTYEKASRPQKTETRKDAKGQEFLLS